MKKNNLLVERITKLLNATFHGGAWHGPSVLEIVKAVKVKQARAKLGTAHKIAELIYHMTSWRIFVVKKMNGDAEYTIAESQNFGHFDAGMEDFELETLLMELSLSHDELISIFSEKTDAFLTEIVPGAEYDFYTLMHGIMHHDLYHAGQIAILNKILKEKTSSLSDEDGFGKSSRYFEEDYDDTF